MSKSQLFEKIRLLPNEEILWEDGPTPKALSSMILGGMFLYLFYAILIGASIIILTKPELVSLQSRAEAVTREHNSTTFDTLYYDSVLTDLKTAKDELEPEYRNIIGSLTPHQHTVFSIMVILILVILKIIVSYRAFKSRWYMITTERVMIQSGIFEKRVSVVDIDRINSIQSFQTIVDQKLGLCNVELVLTGISLQQNNYNGMTLFQNVIQGVVCDSSVQDDLMNNWLIRDNKR